MYTCKAVSRLVGCAARRCPRPVYDAAVDARESYTNVQACGRRRSERAPCLPRKSPADRRRAPRTGRASRGRSPHKPARPTAGRGWRPRTRCCPPACGRRAARTRSRRLWRRACAGRSRLHRAASMRRPARVPRSSSSGHSVAVEVPIGGQSARDRGGDAGRRPIALRTVPQARARFSRSRLASFQVCRASKPNMSKPRSRPRRRIPQGQGR